MRVKALTAITDIQTGALHRAGEVFDFERTPDELRRLMRDGLIQILDGAASPAIVVIDRRDGISEAEATQAAVVLNQRKQKR